MSSHVAVLMGGWSAEREVSLSIADKWRGRCECSLKCRLSSHVC